MALIIPTDVGGKTEVPQRAAEDRQPAKTQSVKLIVPVDVGGTDVPTVGEVARSPEGVLGSQEDRQSRAVKELPEFPAGGILAGESAGTLLQGATAGLFTTDPRELGDILKTISPDIGITQSPEGDLIANNNKTGAKAVLNDPDLSRLDLLQGLGLAAAFTPAARLASVPAKLGTRAAVGGAASGLTEAAIQALQSELGGELNADEIAIATSLGGAAELVVPAIQAFRQGRQAKKVGAASREIEDVAEQVKIGKEASEKTGVPLFQAQQTTVPAQLEKQSFLSQLPAGTQRASKELINQNKAASNAVDEFLNTISPPESIITGAEKFRTASQNAVTKQVLIRKEKSSPLYKNAFSENVNVDVSEVNNVINKIMSNAPEGGQSIRTMEKVKSLIAREKPIPSTLTKPQTIKSNLKKLHNAKLEIDEMINGTGGRPLGNTTLMQLVKVKNSLLDEMDKASGLYKDARKQFEADSPPVTEIQESLIGKLSKVNDDQLKSIARRLFDPAETNPTIIKNAKRIIKDVDPDAWNQILRTELERRMGSIRSTLEAGTTENVPAQLFSAIFGNSKQRKVLFNAVDGETAKNLKYLETVLSRARLGRAGGSPTAAREEIKSELKGGAISAVRDFFSKPVSNLVGSGISAVTGRSERSAFDNRVRILTDSMFNPEWAPKLDKLKKLNINSPAAARAMAQLLNDVERSNDKELEKAKKEADNG